MTQVSGLKVLAQKSNSARGRRLALMRLLLFFELLLESSLPLELFLERSILFLQGLNLLLEIGVLGSFFLEAFLRLLADALAGLLEREGFVQ